MFQQFAHATRASIQIGHRALMLVLACCSAGMLAPHAAAQTCEPTWLPGEPGANVQGTVAALINFDPDGAGPAGNLLIAGGSNLVIPGYDSQKLIAFDGQYWRPLEVGPATGSVNALAIFNNQLVVAGNFTTIAGVAATDVATWNGTTWTPLSSGLGDGFANAVAVYNSQLYVGGSYTNGAATNAIARWTGTTWTSVGGGMTGGSRQINALLSFNGVLFAGGSFTAAGSGVANNLASWNGTTWSAVGNPDDTVYALGSFSGIAIGSSRLFVGGAFQNIGGIASNFVASLRFDPLNGNTWNSHTVTGVPLAASCRALQIRGSGITSFQINAILRISGILGGGGSQGVYRLSGTTWTNLIAPGSSTCFANYAGQMTTGSSGAATNVYTFDNTAWRALGKGTPGRITAMDAGADDVYAGTASTIGSFTSWRVNARDNATGAWRQLGGLVGEPINTILVRSNGNVIAAGEFAQLDGASGKIAEWNGFIWSPLGLGFGTTSGLSVNALAETATGDIIAGGFFNTAGGQTTYGIARWNGIGWSPVGNGILGSVNAVAIASNGDIIAAGDFLSASGTAANNIARWNGVNWLPLAGGLPNGEVYALAILPDGSVVAAGWFDTGGATPLRSIARWNGSAWASMGTGISNGPSQGFVAALRVLPNGNLVAAGLFDNAGGVNVNNIARWDGSTWRAMEEGVAGGTPLLLAPSVAALTIDAGGTLVAGGSFFTAGGEPSAYFARWGLPTFGCCDSIDFNNNTVFPEDQDVIDFFNVLAGQDCPTCNDIDFNNNTVFPEDQDVIDFFTVLAGGTCL
ncbi:MAG TPA: hypothetical protein VK157_13445 [Phycisphaerales bacterium]|nr:hypothetical protein [Phycisphaerales bacterium]